MMIKYEVKKITETSQHEAINYMEDDEMWIVEDVLTGQWCRADEFFHQNDVEFFYVEKMLDPEEG